MNKKRKLLIKINDVKRSVQEEVKKKSKQKFRVVVSGLINNDDLIINHY